MKKLITICAMVMLMGMGTMAQATLINRGGGLIYDDDFNITWLQDAGLGGWKNWGNAMTWAENLSYYDSVRNVTYDDWRLPTALNQDGSDPDWGYNYTGSEMGHLYYTELGNVAGGPLTNTGPFTNLQDDRYWSGTEYVSPYVAWVFNFDDGYQCPYFESSRSAWAVRPGDVVPEPATIGLLSLGALALLRKRRA